MSEAHLDHPGEWRWFHGYGPAEIVGQCPHDSCGHYGTSVIAYGPDFEHYELVTCDDTDGCNGSCRGWTKEYPTFEANRRGLPRVVWPHDHLGWMAVR